MPNLTTACRDCGLSVKAESTTAGLCLRCTNARIQVAEKCKGCGKATHNAGGLCTTCLQWAEMGWGDAE